MMCAFHDSNCNGFGDVWWTDKCTYFSSIDYIPLFPVLILLGPRPWTSPIIIINVSESLVIACTLAMSIIYTYFSTTFFYVQFIRFLGKFGGKVRWENSVGKCGGKVQGESSAGKFGRKVPWKCSVGKFGGNFGGGKFGGKFWWESSAV